MEIRRNYQGRMKYGLVIVCMILGVAACLFMTGCTKSHNERLIDQAGTLMDEYPDSALTILQQVDTATLGSISARARYITYLNNLQYVTYSPDFKDSLLDQEVADYFKNQGKARDKMLFYYIDGIILNNEKDYSQAIVYFLKAADEAKSINDPLYLGRIYRAISGVYTNTWNTSKALEYSKLAHASFSNTQNKPLEIWSLLDIAHCCYNNRDYAESINLVDSCITLSKQTDDIPLYYQCLKIKGYAQIQNNENRAGIHTLKQLGSYIEEKDAYLIALGYYNLRELDSVEYYNNLSLNLSNSESDLSGNLYLEYELERAKGNFTNAIKSLDSLYINKNNIVWKMIGENIANTEIDFHENQTNIKNLEIRHHKWTIFFISVITLMLVIFIIIFHKKQKENLLLKIKTYVQKAENLQTELSENNALKEKYTDITSQFTELQHVNESLHNTNRDLELSKLKLEQENKELELSQKEEIKGILRNELSSRLETINKLGEILFVESISDKKITEAKREKELINKILKVVNEINVSKKTIKHLEKIVDQAYDNAITILKTKLPAIYEKYGRLYLFRALSLSNDTIAYLLQQDSKKIYNDIFRCKQKIADSGLSETDILERPLKLIKK